MGGVDVGSQGGKKSTNADINMVPFIDLLMCTIAFLLITAVWVTNSRMNADAQVPGPPDTNIQVTPTPPEKVLNLYVNESEFALVWKQGATVVSEVRIPKPAADEKNPIRFADLAKRLETEWQQNGSHRDASDKKLDQAIVHTDNRTQFKEIVAVLDALYSTRRKVKSPDGEKDLSVFNMTFAAR